MIHSELHNHFSLINVKALLSFLKAAGSSINLTVHKNSLGNNFLVDVAHTHLHTLRDTQAVHTAKTNPQIHNKDGDVIMSFCRCIFKAFGTQQPYTQPKRIQWKGLDAKIFVLQCFIQFEVNKKLNFILLNYRC